MSNYIVFDTIISKIGNIEDYINLPVTRDGKAIGVINHAEEIEGGYRLTLLIFKSTGIELIREGEGVKPYGFSIG